ncbi:unnamed protein product [Alternaria alternata]
MGAYQTLLAFPPPPVDLKDKLVAEIDKRKRVNDMPVRGGYLTFDFIDRLFTVANIAQQLQKHEEAQRIPRQDITLHAQFIKQHQQKLYAILLLMDNSHYLLSSKAKAVTDRKLFEIPESGLASLPCPLPTLEAFSLFHGFSDAFYKMQFVFPPSLPASRTVLYPPDFIFPFASKPERVGEGSFGEVSTVEIASGILSPLADKDIFKNELVAYKRVRRLGTESWDRVELEYKVLHQRIHRNITPLRASFFAGMEDAKVQSSRQCLYLLSPAAEMSMKGWLEEQRDERPSSGFIYFDTMLALASGLTYIHREIKMMVAYHRDIKPSNILLFHGNEESVVWKFCDFGTSNLKPADNTGTRSMVTDRYWAPPEFFEDHRNDNGVTHGRAHDVFSLGCVFLELVTLLHEGSAGISDFKSRRETQDQRDEGLGPRGAYHRSMTVVRRWIENLRRKHKELQHREVLTLISEMLERIEKRIYSWEVEIDLFMLRQGVPDAASVDEYLNKVGHPSMGYNADIKHNPFLRAKKRAEKNQFYKARCPDKYFYTMKETLGWHDYSHQSTGNFRRTSEQHAYSNLSSFSDEVSLCGGQELYQEISDSFRQSDIVALFGVSGIGKSRNAREYARQFINSEDHTLRRHAFIVNATSTDSLMHSYDDIANIINHSQTGTIGEVTRHTLRSWLREEKTEKWFMVVDGFDSVSDMAELKKTLPTPRTGMDQLLITTRNRAIINEYSRGKAHVPCIKVSALGPADSMRFFKQNIEEWKRLKGEETDTPKIGSLLEKLWSPMMIKYAANQIELTRATVVQFKELVDDSGLSEVTTDFAPEESYLAHILQPLTNNLSQTSSWPRELGTLFLLAFFDSGGVKWSILKENHGTKRKRKSLLTALGTLQDCAFVDKAERKTDPVYSIYGNIRQAILEWIEQNDGGAEGLLKRYNKVLSITYKSYRSSLKVVALKTPDASPRLYQAEQPFMPHFECFVRFAEKYTQQQKPLLHYSAVRGIICFSKVLLDHDRYRQAMVVVEYSRRHYQYRLEEEDSEKQVHTFFTLGRHLITIYLARSEDNSSKVYRTRASKIISELWSKLTHIKNRYPGWTWLTLMSVEIKLDEVRVHRQSANIEQARQILSKISETLNAMSDDDDEVIDHYYENAASADHNSRISQTHLSRQKLLIMAKFQDGLLQMTEGNLKHQKDRRNALAIWRNARKLLLSAEQEVERYHPPDELWHDDIRVAIAAVNIKIGQKSLIRDAISTLESVQGRMEERYGSVRRTMDVKRKLNEARLKSHRKHVNLATQSSRELLHWYTEHFREYTNSGGMTMCTIDCASHLVRGLERMGKRDDLEELKKKYNLEGGLSDIDDSRRLGVLFKLSFLCILVVALCLGYCHQYL